MEITDKAARTRHAADASTPSAGTAHMLCCVPIRVILADDSYIIREGIEGMLADSDEVVVEASCADTDSLLAEVDAREPDVVVTDVRMPPTSTDEGIQVAAALRESHP